MLLIIISAIFLVWKFLLTFFIHLQQTSLHLNFLSNYPSLLSLNHISNDLVSHQFQKKRLKENTTIYSYNASQFYIKNCKIKIVIISYIYILKKGDVNPMNGNTIEFVAFIPTPNHKGYTCWWSWYNRKYKHKEKKITKLNCPVFSNLKTSHFSFLSKFCYIKEKYMYTFFINFITYKKIMNHQIYVILKEIIIRL